MRTHPLEVRGDAILHCLKNEAAMDSGKRHVAAHKNRLYHSVKSYSQSLRKIVYSPRYVDRSPQFSRACYELGRKPHRNADSTVTLVPLRSPFPAFLRRFYAS